MKLTAARRASSGSGRIHITTFKGCRGYFCQNFLRQVIGSCLLILASVSVQAAQYIDHGEYRIHYTTFSSLLIPGEVAAAHGIVRAKNRIILNVSAKKADEAVPMRIEGTVTNLLNQQFELDFEEVTEAGAIYYLANHLAMEQDILRFALNVQPADSSNNDPGAWIRFLRRYD